MYPSPHYVLVEDAGEQEMATRLIMNYAKLSQGAREAVEPVLKELTGTSRT
jgi:hypothetical protein